MGTVWLTSTPGHYLVYRLEGKKGPDDDVLVWQYFDRGKGFSMLRCCLCRKHDCKHVENVMEYRRGAHLADDD